MSKTLRTINLPTLSGTQTTIPDDWVEPLKSVGFTIDKTEDTNRIFWKNSIFGIKVGNGVLQLTRWGTVDTNMENIVTLSQSANWTFAYYPYGEGIIFGFAPTGTNAYITHGILMPRHNNELHACVGVAKIGLGTNSPTVLPNIQGAFTGCHTSEKVLLTKVYDAGSNDFRDDVYYTIVAPMIAAYSSFRSNISGKDILLIKNTNANSNYPLICFDMALIPEDEE